MRLTPQDRLKRILQSTWRGSLGGELRSAQPVILGNSILLDNRMDSGGGAADEYWTEDRKVLTAAGAQSYTLTYTPIEESLTLSLNGLDLDEGFDYTVDWETGIITISATALNIGDVLTGRYQVKAPLAIQTDPVGISANWQIVSNAAKVSSTVSGGPGTLYYGLIDAGSPYNDVTMMVTTPSTDLDVICGRRGIDGTPSITAGYRLGVICQPSTLIWIIGTGTGDRSNTAATGVVYPATIRASYSSDGNLRIYLNGSLVTTQPLLSAERTCFDTATFVGMATLQGSTGEFDSFLANGGVISDSFNRPDAPGLGVADTGDIWEYSP